MHLQAQSTQAHEFGVKATVPTLKECLVLGHALPAGNPYDGHMLDETIESNRSTWTKKQPSEGLFTNGSE